MYLACSMGWVVFHNVMHCVCHVLCCVRGVICVWFVTSDTASMAPYPSSLTHTHPSSPTHPPTHPTPPPGIISTLRVFHEQDFSAPNGGRTDTTSVADKWGAVVAQERYYKVHFGVDLKKCRDNVGLSNSSWNGAVKGYLY